MKRIGLLTHSYEHDCPFFHLSKKRMLKYNWLKNRLKNISSRSSPVFLYIVHWTVLNTNNDPSLKTDFKECVYIFKYSFKLKYFNNLGQMSHEIFLCQIISRSHNRFLKRRMFIFLFSDMDNRSVHILPMFHRQCIGQN